jgi:hypothetical protein
MVDIVSELLRRRAPMLGGMVLFAMLASVPRSVADEVTVKGTVLQGTLTSLSASTIAFQTIYGKGTLLIPFADIQNLTTDASCVVYHGEDAKSRGRLLGVDNGRLLVGASRASATPVAISTILFMRSEDAAGAGDLRSQWRYWHGNAEAAVHVQQSTSDATGFLLALGAIRAKDRTRFTLGASYRYATEKLHDEDRSITQDQLKGLARGEYDFTPRIYGYASGDATYDGIQRLSIRGVPKAGIGYVLWQEKLDEERRNFLQADVGGGWVYERYFGGEDNSYAAIAFGALAGYYLPYGAHADWRMDYLPAVDNFTRNYLLRNELGLTVPLIAVVNARFSLLDEYQGLTAPDTTHNSLFLSAGLGVEW